MGQRSCRLAIVSISRLVSVQAQNPAGHKVFKSTVSGQSFPYCGTLEPRFANYLYPSSCTHYNRYTSRSMSSSKCHVKARCKVYPRTEKLPEPVLKTPVPDEQVPWGSECPGYESSVKTYTSPSVLKGPVWADNPDPTTVTKFNKIDGKVDRTSFVRQYDVIDGAPRNPMGRTGMNGRGCLGRWGPNHAGDPIVTRWKRNDQHEIVHHESSGKPIIQFVAVQRSDNDEWALPGGMVDPGESRTETIKREFGEEALSSIEATEEEKDEIKQTIQEFFKTGHTIYKGYVDDPRNTDNSWMETVAINFHDEDESGVAHFQLKAGDDAKNVQWMDVDSSLNLYASHIEFIHKTAMHRKAHW